MTVHSLRETSTAGPVKLCRIACSDDTFKTEPHGTLEGFASGWDSDIDCVPCREAPLPWRPWKRLQGGEVRDYGVVHLIPAAVGVR